MKIKKSFKIALNIILHSKLRSWLTIIGIVIGIAAVVSIMSIGQGAQRSIEQNLNSLSADTLTITTASTRAQGTGANFRSFGEGPPGGGGFIDSNSRTGSTTKNLSVSDVMALKGINNIAHVTGTISGSVNNITYLSKTGRSTIQGMDPLDFKYFITTELASGRSLSQGDINVVVIGSRVANSTFNNIQINRQISINGRLFRVVGILKESGGNDDSKIFMPIENALIILDGKDKKNFDSIVVKVKDISIIDTTILDITNKLILSHGILQNQRQDFQITSLKSLQERITSTISSVSLFLTAIAVISLIVGAIGIMNTMFTSVLEKTKEIGILKAIGAKDKDILTIFLLNSAIIGVIGGIFGIILGIFVSGYIGSLSGLSGSGGNQLGRLLSTSYISPLLIIEIFILSIVIGLISGLIPAYRASKLEPVDALRYE